MFTTLRSSTLRRRQNADMRAMDRRLLADHARLAQGVGLLIGSMARGGVVPNTRASRDALSTQTWERVLKPYYVGLGEPLRGTAPQSPYAAVLVAGVERAIKLQVDWHAAMLRRYIRDERVLGWLTGPRPMIGQIGRMGQETIRLMSPMTPIGHIQETIQDSFAQWLDPRGFKLADRIQRMAVEIKARMSRFFDYHVGKGTPAPAMAHAAAEVLTTGERGARPYGTQAAYPARRLLQNEMIVAGGNATQNLSRVNPIVMAMKWVVSPAHTESDECDDNATGGPDEDGVYSFELLPVYPAHTKCQCGIFPVAVAKPAEATAALLAGLEQGDAYTASLQGLFNDNWVNDALLSGAFQPAAERVIAARAAVERV